MKNFLLPLILLLAAGCGLKPGSRGNLNEVIVFADPGVYAKCGNGLSRALEKIVHTPQPEKIFHLKPVSYEKFADSTIAANVILLGTLEGEGPFSQYVRDMLDEDARKGIADGVYWFFAKTNAWYNKQLLLVAVANDAEELASRLNFGADELFEVLNESVLQRMSDVIFSTMENKKLSKELMDKFGFRVRIQHDYHFTREEPEERFIRIRRYNPTRWLTVSWQDADTLTEDMVIRERARISALFADTSRIEPEYNVISEENHIPNGKYLLRGLWSTEAAVGGGPFFSYGVFDEEMKRAYFLDGAVFNPGDEKLPYLRQLEVLARSFMIPKINVENIDG